MFNNAGNKQCVMSVEDQTDQRNAATCGICKEEFHNSIKAKYNVRDHRHRTGDYRGAAHSKCN